MDALHLIEQLRDLCTEALKRAGRTNPTLTFAFQQPECFSVTFPPTPADLHRAYVTFGGYSFWFSAEEGEVLDPCPFGGVRINLPPAEEYSAEGLAQLVRDTLPGWVFPFDGTVQGSTLCLVAQQPGPFTPGEEARASTPCLVVSCLQKGE